ncbi:hypothetical protein FA15DRAFT_663049 [Coprinopsis marcescibilis]|uniref:Nucleolar protein 16 n=1 Tax=Coprinopsis marcescibilis TaxID=230819 RepID=A0A5C3L9T0_COPMA|nr:hypothetical protein FA15DRAFT_663049 [Coprinopsis marcescibilis]
MANPRQRRKSRSATHRPVSHSKNAKRNLKKSPTIRGPKALQDAWDKHKTVKQNYAQLGLVHDLNPIASGGSEMQLAPRYEDDNAGPSTSNEPTPTAGNSGSSIPKGFGRIIRDETGKVIGVEIEDDAMEAEDETMEDLEPQLDGRVCGQWTTGFGKSDIGEKAVGLVAELESIASRKQMNSTTLSVPQSSTGPNIRHPAAGELVYLQRLVDKYGDNVERMAKDRKLNPDQRTEGQLRRALKSSGFLKDSG